MLPRHEGEAPSAAQEEAILQLQQVGFERIEQSPLFSANGFTISISPEGRFRFHVDYDRFGKEQGRGKIKAIQYGNFFQYAGDQSLATIRVNEAGEEYPSERTFNGSGGFMRPGEGKISVPELADFAGKGIDQQLLDIGFEPSGGIFHRVLYNVDLHAFVSGDELELLKSAEEHLWTRYQRDILERFGATKVVRFSEMRVNRVSRNPKPEPVLIVRNDVVEFAYDKEGEIHGVKLLREIEPRAIVAPVVEVQEETGFVVNGVNSSELIRGLTTINDQTIEDLEERMQPAGWRSGGISNSGFLDYGQELFEVLTEDNDFVLSKGLTHQQLGQMVKYVEAITRLGVSEFSLQGRRFTCYSTQWRGSQESPFMDSTETDTDLAVINTDNGKKFQCSALLGEMITRYGFYEGEGTEYRLSPEAIIETFDFLLED